MDLGQYNGQLLELRKGFSVSIINVPLLICFVDVFM